MEQAFQSLKPEFDDKIAFININVNDPFEQALCAEYHIQYIPTTYFLNSKGEAIFNYAGVIKRAELKSGLQALAEGK